jgi:hypothetical protein
MRMETGMTLEEILKLHDLTKAVKWLNRARGPTANAFDLHSLRAFFDTSEVPQELKATLAENISVMIGVALDRAIRDVERKIEQITGSPLPLPDLDIPPPPLPEPTYYDHKPGDPPPDDATRCILVDLLFSNGFELLNVRPVHLAWDQIVGWRPATSGK